MTLRSFINFGETSKTGAGINLWLRDNKTELSFAILRQEKDGLRLLQYEEKIESPEALKKILGQLLVPGSPVHINIEGKGILTRGIGLKEIGDDSQGLVKKLFPMVKETEFISQLVKGRDAIYLTVGRNDLAEGLMQALADFSITGLSLDLLMLTDLGKILGRGTVELHGKKVSIENGELIRYEEAGADPGPDFTFDNQTLCETFLPAVAGAWGIFNPKQPRAVYGIPSLENSMSKFSFLKKLYATCRYAAAFILAALLVNAAAWFYVDGENSRLELLERSLTSTHRKNEQGNKDDQVTEAAYASIGWKVNTRPVYYADQIARGMTAEIRLTGLEIGVLDDQVFRKERRHQYRPDLIRVRGTSANSESLWNWLNKVEKMKWVKEVVDQKYRHDVRSGKGIFEFYIRTR